MEVKKLKRTPSGVLFLYFKKMSGYPQMRYLDKSAKNADIMIKSVHIILTKLGKNDKICHS